MTETNLEEYLAWTEKEIAELDEDKRKAFQMWTDTSELYDTARAKAILIKSVLGNVNSSWEVQRAFAQGQMEALGLRIKNYSEWINQHLDWPTDWSNE